jgi:hypothetical protein
MRLVLLLKVRFSASPLDRLMIWASRNGESARNQRVQGSSLVEPITIMGGVVADGAGGWSSGSRCWSGGLLVGWIRGAVGASRLLDPMDGADTDADPLGDLRQAHAGAQQRADGLDLG